MTTTYQGLLSDILAQGSWDDLITSPVPESFRSRWGMLKLKPTKLLFVDPPVNAIFGALLPVKGQDLAFTGDIPDDWRRWSKRHKVDIKAITPLTEASIRQTLSFGVRHLTLSPNAIDWLCHNLVFPVSRQEMTNIGLLLVMTYPEPRVLSAEEVALAIGGTEQMLASKLLDSLGKPEAVRLANSIATPSEAVPLFVYLEKAVRRRRQPWLIQLNACRKGAIDLRYDYKTALVIFTLCCLNTSSAATTPSSLSASMTPILDLFRISGMPFWTHGSMTAF